MSTASGHKSPSGRPASVSSASHEHGKIRSRAVLFGWISGFGVLFLLGVLLYLVAEMNLYGMILSEMPPEDISNRTAELARWYGMLDVLRSISGGLVGGSVAAWFARHRPITHGVAVGIALFTTMLLFTGIVWWFLIPEEWPPLIGIVALLAIIPAAAVGGYVREISSEPIQDR